MASLPTPVDGRISLAQLHAWAQEFDSIGTDTTAVEFVSWLRPEVEPYRRQATALRDEDGPRGRWRGKGIVNRRRRP